MLPYTSSFYDNENDAEVDEETLLANQALGRQLTSEFEATYGFPPPLTERGFPKCFGAYRSPKTNVR